YLDTDSNLIGSDLDFVMNVEFDASLSIDVLLEGGGEQVPVDFNAAIELGYEIQGAQSEWRLGEPSTLYADFSSGNDIYWVCDEERYIDLWDDEIWMHDDCGEVSGDYSATVDYSFSLSGMPTQDFGLDEGQFDVSVSDELSNAGTFSTEFPGNLDFIHGTSLSVDLGDDSSPSVSVCESCPPGQPLMFNMMGATIAGVSVDLGETISEDLEDNLLAEDGLFGWLDGLDSSDDSSYASIWDDQEYTQYWMCDNGEEIYQWYYNDGEEDCSDGSDEPDLAVNGYISTYGEFEWYISNDLPAGTYSEFEFLCANGDTIYWSWANDGEADCTDGSDESTDPSDLFDCDDGTTVLFSFVNDGEFDCENGFDEGVELFELDITMYVDGSPAYTESNMLCSSYHALCEDYLYSDYLYSSGIIPVDMDVGDNEYCMMATFSGQFGTLSSNANAPCSSQWFGHKLYSAESRNNDMTLSVNAWVGADGDSSTFPETNLVFTVFDELGNTVETESMLLGEEENDYYYEFIAPEESEYCFDVSLQDADAGQSYQSLFVCSTAQEEPEPSDRLVTVIEALADSNFPNVLETFAMNLEDRLGDIVAEDFPYEDGMWAPMWSNQHATVVGVGVYVMDANGDWYILTGPETAGYSSDAPAHVSIRYITGVEAMNAQQIMAESTELADIVDTSTYDFDALEQALQNAGVDTSNLDFGQDDDQTQTENGDNTAEEAAEDAGLLPFLSPLSLLCILGAAFIVGRRGKKEE
ncbi:MAG: low-density lipoprotein receptor class A repeat-containing protein, partial [archaeon]|nr:low-density lipoprotein receptor class A repeat-containing protein [archaeon]